MKVVRQARLELSGGSTPDQLRPSTVGVMIPGRPRQYRRSRPERRAWPHLLPTRQACHPLPVWEGGRGVVARGLEYPTCFCW